LREVADWIGRYRAFWEGSLDRLEEFVQDLQMKERKRGQRKRQAGR
jgi:hypothetical protein